MAIDIAASGVLLFWVLALLVTMSGWRSVHELPDVPESAPSEKEPLISVIVAAKEEEHSIADTIRHLMNQNAGRLEIIAVNDRSADATGSRLDDLKRWSEQKKDVRVPLKVVHITRLPQGWVGKNHALYQGYLQARGSILLFTDADVRFQPDVVRDAALFMNRAKIDHLTLSPAMSAHTFLLKAFVHYFLFSLTFARPPWLANKDGQKRFGFGIGAFNMITRQAYERIGTHERFAMRPDDDLHMGMLVKQAGMKQRFLSCAKRLEVEWYPSLRDSFRGLEKNLYSGFRYNPILAMLGMLGQLLFFFLPFVGMVFGHGWNRAFFLVSAALLCGCYVYVMRKFSRSAPWDVLALPLSVLMVVYVIGRSAYLSHRRGGMIWRGTFYSLKRLKKMQK